MIKKILSLILVVCSLFSCAEPTKMIQVGELNVTVPSKWAIGQQGDTEFLNVSVVIGKYCEISISVSKIELNPNYIKYNRSNALPEKTFQYLICQKEEKGSFLGAESVELPFSATVAQQSVEGKVIVFNKYNQTVTITYSYIKDSKQGKNDVETVLSSISLSQLNEKPNQTFDQRIQAYVAVLNKVSPVTNQEGIILDSVEIKGSQLILSYYVDFIIDLSPQEIVEASKEMKDGILMHTVQTQNSVVYEWLNKGNDIWHKYYTKEKQLFMNIKVTVDDIKRMESIIQNS